MGAQIRLLWQRGALFSNFFHNSIVPNRKSSVRQTYVLQVFQHGDQGIRSHFGSKLNEVFSDRIAFFVKCCFCSEVSRKPLKILVTATSTNLRKRHPYLVQWFVYSVQQKYVSSLANLITFASILFHPFFGLEKPFFFETSNHLSGNKFFEQHWWLEHETSSLVS